MKIILIFFIIWTYRLISNIYYLHKTKSYQKDYFKELNTHNSNTLSNQLEIRRTLEKAGVYDGQFTAVQPIGYGKIANFQASVYDNMCGNHIDIANTMISAFIKAIGVYHNRIKENFNPIFWIESLLFLPKNIINYVGLDKESVISKIFQIVYWLIGTVYLIYSDKINIFIQGFISNLFK